MKESEETPKYEAEHHSEKFLRRAEMDKHEAIHGEHEHGKHEKHEKKEHKGGHHKKGYHKEARKHHGK